MNADEIVKALRDDFAPQVREMCANDDFSCDELCAGNIMTSQCIIFQAADLITSQQAEIQVLKANSMIQEQIIKRGSNPIDRDKIVSLILKQLALQAEIDRLTAENKQLAVHGGKYMQISEQRYEQFEKCIDKLEQAELRNDGLTALNKEAVELLGLAVEDMRHCADDTGCEVCRNSTCTGFGDCNFVWQHADRYEELKKRMEKLKGEEEDRQSSKR